MTVLKRTHLENDNSEKEPQKKNTEFWKKKHLEKDTSDKDTSERGHI